MMMTKMMTRDCQSKPGQTTVSRPNGDDDKTTWLTRTIKMMTRKSMPVKTRLACQIVIKNDNLS